MARGEARVATSRTVWPALGLAVLLATCGAAAAEPAARSGNYESLTLAVSGSAVAGVFAEQRGTADPGGPQFSCIFLMRGTLAGDGATVETWYPGEPERIAGRLDFTRGGAALTLSENHGGCLMTTGSMERDVLKADRADIGRPDDGDPTAATGLWAHLSLGSRQPIRRRGLQSAACRREGDTFHVDRPFPVTRAVRGCREAPTLGSGIGRPATDPSASDYGTE